MKRFRGLFIILILCSKSIVVQGQQIECYELSMSVLHSGYSMEKEWYSKINNERVHRSNKILFDIDEKLIEKNRDKDSLEDTQIERIDSLFKLQQFKFTVSRSVIDSITNYVTFNNNIGITQHDIDNFFSNNNTVSLNIDDIQREKLLFVIDGTNFSIDLTIKRIGKDTLFYELYRGNLDDGVRAENIYKWIPTYLFIRENKVFDAFDWKDQYFSDENLQHVLMKFILWNKRR